jgi:hypothetical protein
MRLVPSLLVSGASLAVCSFLACTKSEPEKPAAAPTAATAAVPAPTTSIQGSVLEVLPASPYTYLRVKAAQGEVWTAVPAADVKVGATVNVLVQVRMDQFQSSALKRTFDSVYMGTLAGAAPAAAAPAAAAPAAPHAAPAFPTIEKVAKATGADAHSIAEIYAKKKDLKDRTVTVRGKVMKCMGGIMGKTWIHLCDGSGTPEARDFDLAVTTQDTAKVGDVVTIKGVLHLDRDFGSGYTYPVILEEAKIAR